MWKAFKTIFRDIDKVLAGTAVSVLIALTIISVFMRYIFGKPIAWVEEVSIALFVWTIMLGASTAMREKAHVSIDFIVDYFPHKSRKINNIIVIIVNFIVVGIVIAAGLQFALQAGDKITPVLGISYTFIDISVPIGGVLMMLHMIANIKDDLNKGCKKRSDE